MGACSLKALSVFCQRRTHWLYTKQTKKYTPSSRSPMTDTPSYKSALLESKETSENAKPTQENQASSPVTSSKPSTTPADTPTTTTPAATQQEESSSATSTTSQTQTT